MRPPRAAVPQVASRRTAPSTIALSRTVSTRADNRLQEVP